MEVYKTTVNAYKRLLENPAHGEVCGVPTLVGTKSRKARVRATAVVESNGSSCKLLCMPHAGMASDVDVVRVAPGDGTVVGSGGVSIRTNAEHLNSEFVNGGVRGRLVAAQLCVSNVTSQSNGVLYAACDQNRKDISGYEPVDIVSSIKEGNMVVASAQAEKVTVLYKPSMPEEIDEWVEDVQEGPYGGTRDINANSYPASHAVIWQGNNNAADYERPSGEQLTAYEQGTSYELFDEGTTTTNLYDAGPSITKVDATATVARLDGNFSKNIINHVSNPGSVLKFGVFNGDWAMNNGNAAYWHWMDAEEFHDTGVVVNVGSGIRTFIAAIYTPLTVSELSNRNFANIEGTASYNNIPLVAYAYDDVNGFSYKISCESESGSQENFIRNGYSEIYHAYDGSRTRTLGPVSSVNYDDAFEQLRTANTGKQIAVCHFWWDFDFMTNSGVYTSGTRRIKLHTFKSYGMQAYSQVGFRSASIDDLWNGALPTTSVTELTSSSTVNQQGQQQSVTLQGASVTGVNQGNQFEYSAEIQTVSVPQRLLVEFDAVYEYSGENVLTAVTANPMRGNKDLLPRVHNNVFASPLSGNQRAYRRYDIDSARVGSTKRKSM